MFSAKKSFIGIIASAACIFGGVAVTSASAAPVAQAETVSAVHHVAVAAIQVRASSGKTVTVVAGDTLSGLFGSRWQQACSINHLRDCNLIRVGQRLTVPSGSSVHAAASSAPAGDREPDGHGDDPGTASGSGGSSSASAGGGTIGAIPGMPQSFAACIAQAKSSSTYGSTTVGNPAAGGNAYGIIPASGYNVAGMSIAQQNQIAGQLYAADGTAPWAPYDGC